MVPQRQPGRGSFPWLSLPSHSWNSNELFRRSKCTDSHRPPWIKAHYLPQLAAFTLALFILESNLISINVLKQSTKEDT